MRSEGGYHLVGPEEEWPMVGRVNADVDSSEVDRKGQYHGRTSVECDKNGENGVLRSESSPVKSRIGIAILI